jgi:hypothetical protein
MIATHKFYDAGSFSSCVIKGKYTRDTVYRNLKELVENSKYSRE